MKSTSFVPSMVLLCGLIAVGHAHAQESDEKRAAALFTEGREALARGDTAAACDKFRESFRLGKRPSAVLNLAQCEETQGRLADAVIHWKEGSSMLESSDERVAVANEHLRAIEPRIPRIRLRMAPRIPSSARVAIDGTPVSASSLNTSIPVNPGTHEVVLSISGRPDQRKVVVLKEHEQQDVVFGSDPILTVTPTDPHEPPPSQGRKLAAWTAGGVGAAGLITAAVTGAMILSKKSAVDDNCPNKVCNSAGRDAIDSAGPLVTVNYVGWGVGILNHRPRFWDTIFHAAFA